MQSQVVMPAYTRHQWEQLQQLSRLSEPLKMQDLESFPAYAIGESFYVSVMGHLVSDPNWSALSALGVMKGSVVGEVATAKIPISMLSQVDLSLVFSYMEMPAKVAPLLDRVRFDVGADSVYYGAGLPEGYDGENVLIGITDWGFEYTHPMFYDTLLQQSRVIAAWDQFKNSGPHPAGYSYGTVYETSEALMDVGGDTANIYSFGTHGSHVAGIAGGGGAGIQYRGIAPAAGFLFTTFLIDAASVIDGFHWMQQVAQQQGKRLVINMSWGLTYMGTLDGTSLLSQVIDQMSEEGVVFVASAGNNGDNNHHIKHTFANSEFQTRINFDAQTPQPNNWGESITMWGEPNQTFWSKLQVYNSLNALQAETPQMMTNEMPSYFDSLLVIGNDTVFFNVTTDSSFPTNERPHMRLRVRNQSNSLKIILNSGAESGVVHYWNIVELANGVGNWGLPFTSFGTTVVNGDSEYSIAEPTCASSCISVAAYSARYLSNFGNLIGGGIAPFRSYGPLLNEVQKPDIAAPGVNVCSSISSFTDASYTSIDEVDFNGTTYDFARFSGTSMSSPCVAGIVALLLDANPLLTPAQVKEILIATARTDEFTGPISAPGDVRWGMGKVDARAALMMALATEGLSVQLSDAQGFSIFPNPAAREIFIYTASAQQPARVMLVDMSGRQMELPVVMARADVSSLASGIYIVQVKDGLSTYRTRIMVNH